MSRGLTRTSAGILSNCELCLVFRRWKIPMPRGARNVRQMVHAQGGGGAHSEKPVEVMQGTERMFPTQNKIEMFARKRSDGWDAWGLEISQP